MSFNIPHESQYRLEPPANMLWIKRHYCPLVEKELDFERLKSIMSNTRRSQERYPKMFILVNSVQYDHNVDICHDLFGNVVEGEVSIGTVFVKERVNSFEEYERCQQYACVFPIDGNLHIIPYLFKGKSINEDFFDKDGKWTGRMTHLVLSSVDDHWQRLKGMNIIPHDAMEKCYRV